RRGDRIRRLRNRLSVYHVAAPPANAPLLAPEPPTLLFTKTLAGERRAAAQTHMDQYGRAEVHRPALAHSLGGSLVHILGMYSGGDGYFSALIRLDTVRNSSQLSKRLRRIYIWFAGIQIRPGQRHSPARVQHPGYLGGSGFDRDLLCSVAAR